MLVRINSEDPNLWITILDAFEMLLKNQLAEFEQVLPSYPEKVQPALKALSWLSYDTGMSLEDKYGRQLAIAYHFLTAADQGLGHALYGLGHYLHNFWIQAAQRHGVILSNPQLLRTDLEGLSPNCSGQTVAKVLIKAQNAMKMRLPERVSELLHKYAVDKCI